MSRLNAIVNNLSVQAKVALTAGFLLLIRAVMSAKSLNAAAAIGILSGLGTMVISTYAVDCYSKGQCELLAWFASISMFVSSILLLVNAK
jgi:hypothetical protein